jgi:hypothetical protein
MAVPVATIISSPFARREIFRKLSQFVVLIILAVSTIFSVQAQMTTGRVFGNLQDPNSAVISGTNVRISNTKTNDYGEFHLANQFSAEFGRARGGQVTTTTKSGIDEYHGTAYGFFFNRYLNTLDNLQKRAGVRLLSGALPARAGEPVPNQQTRPSIDAEQCSLVFNYSVGRGDDPELGGYSRVTLNGNLVCNAGLLTIQASLRDRTQGYLDQYLGFGGCVLPWQHTQCAVEASVRTFGTINVYDSKYPAAQKARFFLRVNLLAPPGYVWRGSCNMFTNVPQLECSGIGTNTIRATFATADFATGILAP